MEDLITGKPGTLPFTLKHINDLQIGDEIIFTIPEILDIVGKVCFINKELGFVFTECSCEELDEDDDPEEQRGLPILPNKDGNYRLYDREKAEAREKMGGS